MIVSPFSDLDLFDIIYQHFAFLVIDDQQRIVKTNTRLDTLFGYQPLELFRQDLNTIIPQDRRQHHTTLVEAYMSAPRTIHADKVDGLCKDGRLIKTDITLYPFTFLDKQYVLAGVQCQETA